MRGTIKEGWAVLLLLAAGPANAGGFLQDPAGTAQRAAPPIVQKGIVIVEAPVKAQVEVVKDSLAGKPVSTESLVNAAVPNAAMAREAAKQGVPGAAEARDTCMVGPNLVAAIAGIRKRVDETEQTVHKANELLETARATFTSMKQTSDDADALLGDFVSAMRRANKLETTAIDIIADAEADFRKADPNTAEGQGARRELREFITRADGFLSTAQRIRDRAHEERQMASPQAAIFR